MRFLSLVMFVSMLAPSAMAGHFRGPTLSTDQARLVLHTDHGDVLAPDTDAGQEGFADPRVSPDGRMAGWLVLVHAAGRHLPLPMALVLFRDGKIVRRFDAGLAVIDGWAFVGGGNAVAYATSTAYSPTGFDYELRRISDGHLLGKFHCGRTLVGTPPNATITGNWAHRDQVPAWVWPIAQDCPVRQGRILAPLLPFARISRAVRVTQPRAAAAVPAGCGGRPDGRPRTRPAAPAARTSRCAGSVPDSGLVRRCGRDRAPG